MHRWPHQECRHSYLCQLLRSGILLQYPQFQLYGYLPIALLRGFPITCLRAGLSLEPHDIRLSISSPSLCVNMPLQCALVRYDKPHLHYYLPRQYLPIQR